MRYAVRLLERPACGDHPQAGRSLAHVKSASGKADTDHMAGRNTAKNRDRTVNVTVSEPHGSEQEGAPADIVVESLDALAEVLSSLEDPSGHEVLFYEINDRGQREVLHKCGPAEFDPFTFGQEFGGGNYIAQVKQTAGRKKFVTEKRFSVSKMLKGSRRSSTPAPTTPAPSTDNTFLTLAMSMMQQAGQQTQAMMQQQAAMLTALVTKPADLSMRDVLPLVMKQGQPDDIDKMLRGVQTLQEMAGGGDRSGGGETSSEWAWLGPVVAEVIKGMAANNPAQQAPPRPKKPVQNNAQKPAAAAAAPAKPSASPTPPPAVVVTDQAGGASGSVDAEIAPSALVVRSIRAQLVAAVVLEGGIDPQALADQVVQTSHDDSLIECMASIPNGGLCAVLAQGAPPILAAQLTDETLRATVDRFEEAIRTLIGGEPQPPEDADNVEA